MLCRRCRRRLSRDSSSCTFCGASKDATPSFDLVVDGRSRIPVVGELTIGRAAGNTVQLSDPSVSRWHARIAPAHDGDGATATIEDVGSSYGTWLDGARLDTAGALHDGSRIRIGSRELLVERRRSDSEAGRTFVVPAGASAILDHPPAVSQTATTRFGIRPRLRSGYALKRLAAAEGPRRWLLKRLDSGRFIQLSDANERLLSLVDGQRTLHDLVGAAEQRYGGAGRARLVSLLSELSEGGFLAGTGTAIAGDERDPTRRRVLVREKSWAGAAEVFDRIY